MIQPKSEECDHIKFLIEEKDSEEEAFYEDLDGFEENGTQETRISPYTFCKAFPFHLMFDKDLMLTQCGNAIYRVLPQVLIHIQFCQTLLYIQETQVHLVSIDCVFFLTICLKLKHKLCALAAQTVAVINYIQQKANISNSSLT